MVYVRHPDGSFPMLEDWNKMDEGGRWAHSPLYEELIRIPLLICAPDVAPGTYKELTSAIDVMPTVLDILGQKIQGSVEGASLLPKMHDVSLSGRDYVISTIPFANPGDPVRSVDDFLRMLQAPTVTTITTGRWSLIYSIDEGVSELYDLGSNPKQHEDLISRYPDVAKELHQYLVKFMRDTNVPERLLKPRLKLCL